MLDLRKSFDNVTQENYTYNKTQCILCFIVEIKFFCKKNKFLLHEKNWFNRINTVDFF